MHDGGLLGSKTLEFVPGTNFHVLQIISIIIIKRGINITPLHFFTFPLTSIFICIGIAFFLPPLPIISSSFTYMTVTQGRTSGGLFSVEIARKFDR